jgi:hypothetical protein
MSKNLARLLNKDESEVADTIAVLEKKNGFPSEDVRLLAENRHKIRSKIHQLGLDPDDTTDKELYHGLRARFERDSQMLNKALGVSQSTKFDEKLNKAVQLVNHCASAEECWVIKNSVIKSILTKNPPRQVAKALNYRSIASMLKRVDIAEIYLAGLTIESAAWQRNVTKSLNKLNGSHYELRPIKIVTLRSSEWGTEAGPDSHLIYDSHIGAVAIWPSTNLMSASVLNLTLLLLEGIRSLNPTDYSEAIHELSPALLFWADAQHLISDGERPVSLNLKDVALNHLKRNNLHTAVTHNGVQSLWNELASRYNLVGQSIEAKIPDIQINFERKKRLKLPTGAELAEEYAVLE